MATTLHVLLIASAVVVICSARTIDFTPRPFSPPRNDCLFSKPCFPSPNKAPPLVPRWPRSVADDSLTPDTKVIYSDLPSDQILQKVRRDLSPFEEAEIIENYQTDEASRQKRAVRATGIKVCNKRTRKCAIIIVYRRV